MSAVLIFMILAALMTGVSVYVLVRPMLVPPSREDALPSVQAQAALAVLQEQLAELEFERKHGLRDPALLDSQRSELERRALQEGLVQPHPLDVRPSRGWAVIVGALVVMAGAAGYLGWGEPAVLMADHAPTRHASGDDDAIRKMVNDMAARLSREAGTTQEWLMLARSYIVLGDYDSAIAAFVRMGDDALADGEILADWAEAVALKHDRVDEQSEALALQALKADPDNIKALLLVGTAAYERQDYAHAVEHWQRVLEQYPDDEMPLLRDTVADALDRLAAGNRQN